MTKNIIRTFTLTVHIVSDNKSGLRLDFEVSDGVGLTCLAPFDAAVEELARQIRKALPSDPIAVRRTGL